MKGTNCISKTKNEILNMDSIFRDDATIVAENAINESLDPTRGSEEREQSSDHRFESLHNKLEDLPVDEIVIKEKGIEEIEAAKNKSIASSDAAEAFSTRCSEMNLKKDDVLLHGGSNYTQELLDTCGTSKRTMRCKRPVKDNGEMRKFNPQEPNYLPVELETEGERIDLRHQEIDERKNVEDWMLDYALQQAVSKLALARKRKVALLLQHLR
ncbi:hypothetical protein Ancab_017453 [Ancistrocladus abbreviatus]